MQHYSNPSVTDSYKTNDIAQGELEDISHLLKPPDLLPIFLEERDILDTRVMYNFWADTYNKDMDANQYQGPRLVADYMKNDLNIPTEASILDVGCGTGVSGTVLKQDFGFEDIDGVDISELMASFARKTGCYKKINLAKIEPTAPLDFASRQYDCILLCTSFLPGHIRPDCLPNLCQLLKPDGGCIVWIGPPMSILAERSAAFAPESLNQGLQMCCQSCNMQAVPFKPVRDFYQGMPGEIGALVTL